MRYSRRWIGWIGRALFLVAALRVLYVVADYWTTPGGGARPRLESSALAAALLGLIVIWQQGGFGRADRTHASTPLTRRQWAAALAISGLLVYALFGSALTLGFLSDDFAIAALARSGRLWFEGSPFLRPVPVVLWKVASRTGNIDGFAVHAMNLALHALNGAQVVALLTACGAPFAVAVGGGTMFLTFPSTLEATAWCAGMQDVLMTAFVLGAVNLTVLPNGGRFRLAGAVCCHALALGSKETAIVAPILVLIAGLMAAARARRMFTAIVAMTVTTIAYLVVRVVTGAPLVAQQEISRYIVKELIVRPLPAFVLPWRRDALSAHPYLAILACCIFVALISFVIVRSANDRGLARRTCLALLWILVSVVPVWSGFYISPELEGSRFLYLGSVGWAMLVATLAQAFARGANPTADRYAAALSLALGVSVLYAVSARAELGRWRAAAILRDEVVASASQHLRRAGSCAGRETFAPPDSLNGIFVFREGFPEVIERQVGVRLDDRPFVPACHLVWRDGDFIGVSP